MREFQLPYGKSKQILMVDDRHLAGALQSGLHDYQPEKDGSALVQEALENPIGSPRLCDLAVGKKKVVVISSDHTRPVPSRIMMPLILKEIRLKNPDADITILVSTGLHRPTTRQELLERYGEEIFRNEKIVVHDCDDEENLVSIGRLPSGGNLIVNRIAAFADLLVGEGFIEPHFFAGFSGGRKSVLPGIASRETVMYNHNANFIASPYARTGVLDGNPVHNDMLYAARAIRLAFIVNVVIDAAHEPVYAVAGDCDLAHRAGTDFLASKCRVDAVPADIAVTTNGGYPLDQNIYQAVKGMTAAEATVKKDGVIVMLSRANDGDGGRSFHETFKNERNLQVMMNGFLETLPENTIIDQWQSQILCRVLMKAKVIFVSDCDDRTVEEMHMIPARNVEEAMEIAVALTGKDDYTVTVIPDGVGVIVRNL
ncbi:MAG: nickel-dependent lactate racemase [Eubacteriales bacterium]|nr:nickel-dependent lactate racemase [Eubacteriales bacterium]